LFVMSFGILATPLLINTPVVAYLEKIWKSTRVESRSRSVSCLAHTIRRIHPILCPIVERIRQNDRFSSSSKCPSTSRSTKNCGFQYCTIEVKGNSLLVMCSQLRIIIAATNQCYEEFEINPQD
jgi:hypothetical protein